MKNFLKLLIAFSMIQGCFQGAFATLNDVDKTQIFSKNLLSNGGFENGKFLWTASAGTFAVTTTSPMIGRTHATWDAAASADTLTSTAVSIPVGMYGRNGVVSCLITTASGTATHSLQAYDGSNILATAAITSSANPARTSVNFVFGSSGSISLRLYANANEVSIAIDDCFIGPAEGFNLGASTIASSVVDYGAISLASTGTSLVKGTGAGVDKFYGWRVGDRFHFVAQYAHTTAGTAGTGQYLVTLPTAAGCTIDTAKTGTYTGTDTTSVDSVIGEAHARIVTTQAIWGKIYVYDSTRVGIFSAASTAPGATYMHGGNTGAASAQYFSMAQANLGWTLIGSVPCSNWAGSGTTFAPDTSASMYAGQHENTCQWSNTTPTTPVFPGGDATCSLTTRVSQNFPTVTTCSDGTGPTPCIKFTPTVAGMYYVCATPSIYLGGTGTAHHSLQDGNGFVIGEAIRTGSTNARLDLRACGFLNVSSVGTEIELKSLTGSNSLTVTWNASVNSSPTISWEVIPVSQSVPAPLLVNSVVNPREGVTNICSGYVVNNGTTTLTREDGNCVGTLTDNGTGDTTIPFTSGTFSSTPNCTCSTYSGSGRICEIDSTTALSSTTLRVQTIDAAALATDADFMFICIGPK